MVPEYVSYDHSNDWKKSTKRGNEAAQRSAGLKHGRTPRPTKEILVELCKTHTAFEISALYKRQRGSAYKWMADYGIAMTSCLICRACLKQQPYHQYPLNEGAKRRTQKCRTCIGKGAKVPKSHVNRDQRLNDLQKKLMRMSWGNCEFLRSRFVTNFRVT